MFELEHNRASLHAPSRLQTASLGMSLRCACRQQPAIVLDGEIAVPDD
jgi:hypothetical protein